MTPSELNPELDSTRPGHEPTLVNVRIVALGTLGLVALILLTMWGMSGLWRALPRGIEAQTADATLETPPRTLGLEPDQYKQREALEEEQRDWLMQFAWLDESQQRARISMERARKIAQDEGLDKLTTLMATAGESGSEAQRNGADTEDRP